MHIHTFFGDWVPGRTRGHAAALHRQRRHGRARHGKRPRADPRRRGSDVARGRLLGPRMVVSGPMLDGPKSQFPASIPIATPEDGHARRRDARRAAASTSSRSSRTCRATPTSRSRSECRRPGASSSPATCPTRSAPRRRRSAGQKSFEHLIGVFEGSSSAERSSSRRAPKGPARFLETYDPRRRPRSIGAPREEPDLAVPDALLGARPVARRHVDVTKDPDARYAPASWREKSWPTFTKRNPEGPGDRSAARPARSSSSTSSSIVARLHRAGVPFLAGHGHARRRRTSSRGSASTASCSASSTPASRPWRPCRPRRSTRRASSRSSPTSAPSRRARSPTSSSSTRTRWTTSATPAGSGRSSRTAATTRASSWTASWRTSRATPGRTEGRRISVSSSLALLGMTRCCPVTGV